MPELPEVETIRNGILPHLKGRVIAQVVLRRANLRWPITENLEKILTNLRINDIERRGKYLLFQVDPGTLIIHLGMSGYLRVLPLDAFPGKHDHFDLIMASDICLRFNDSRRFGAVLWTDDYKNHPLIKGLGPEPLSADLHAEYLMNLAKNRHLPVKSFIMDGKIVVGVGNIYANEALFKAKIHPLTAVNSIQYLQWQRLVAEIKSTLALAIEAGGTTLKDFRDSDGKPGYFQQTLKVYGRGNQACYECETLLVEDRINQRTTVFCPRCQVLI